MYYERNFPNIFMAPQTPENGSESRDLPPESGTIRAAETGNVEGIRSELHGSFLDVSEARQSNSTDGAASTADVPQANCDSLSDADRQALFSGLQTTLWKRENCDGVSGKWDVIEAALKKNPRMMLNLKRLQDMGAELVVSDFQDGQYVEFADVRNYSDTIYQERALAALTTEEIEAAIECKLQSYTSEEQAALRPWIHKQLERQKFSHGLNFVEATIHAMARGGRLFTYEEEKTMAQKNRMLLDTIFNWQEDRDLLDIMKGCLFAPKEGGVTCYGRRGRGGTFRSGSSVYYRFNDRGGRVAGLRVPIT